ncbi:GNAT family N-acetyltransferase [Taibaiella lutea]|uniref:GNAT family N-acetyltransferase n=1 Tax=Taibaiella lutea TaxID=2608001 RepID=A0A5M6CB90_9BACT|nr:GNAT family protein [Taibaiella lutea]KAA5532446.1 GNAT family N-acetyltransferase [Taibaiella lutea]
MLQTERLNIRELQSGDLHNIHALHSLPETDEFNTLGIPENLQVTEELLNNWLAEKYPEPRSQYVFCIELNESNRFIGLIAINKGRPKLRRAEVWFKIHKDYWNRGYTTEALIKILEFGFNHLHLHRIEAGCAVENIASARVIEKAGMIREGMCRKDLPIRGMWKDSYSYAILEEEFNKNIIKNED